MTRDVAAELRARAEKAREEPAGFWREVPCGHPPDPIAARIGPDYVCHCGWTLDPEDGVAIDEAPGPVVPCRKCGCHVACPPEPSSTEPAPAEEARVEPTADEREAIRRAAKLIDADFASEVVRALNGYLSREPAPTEPAPAVREEARVEAAEQRLTLLKFEVPQ